MSLNVLVGGRRRLNSAPAPTLNQLSGTPASSRWPTPQSGASPKGGNSRFSVDPATGRLILDGQLLERNDPRLWGNSGVGFVSGNTDYRTPIAGRAGPSRWVTANNVAPDESGNGYTTYELTPEAISRLRGRVQLGQSGWAGPNGEGWNEFIDPSLLEYDEEFGFLTDPSNIRGRDPTERRQSNTAAAIVGGALLAPAVYAAVGGMGAGAGAAEGTIGGIDVVGSGPGWALEGGSGAAAAGGAGVGASAGGTATATGTGATSGGMSQVANLLKNPVVRTLIGLATGGGNNGSNGGNGNTNGGGNNPLNGILNLLASGGAYARGRNNLSDYRTDMNSMISQGMPVKQEDRQPYIDLIRNIGNGTISGDELYKMVPGLSALSARGEANLGRKHAARGQGQPIEENAGWQREFLEYDKELTSKYVGEYLDRASKNAGYQFDPSNMMGRGLQGLGAYYGGLNDVDSDFAGAIGRYLNGGNGNSGGGILDLIGNIFGNNSGDIDWDSLLGGVDGTDWDEIGNNDDGFWGSDWGNDDGFAGP